MENAILEYYNKNKETFDKLILDLSELIINTEEGDINSIKLEIFGDKSAGLYAVYTNFHNLYNESEREISDVGLNKNAVTSLH